MQMYNIFNNIANLNLSKMLLIKKLTFLLVFKTIITNFTKCNLQNYKYKFSLFINH